MFSLRSARGRALLASLILLALLASVAALAAWRAQTERDIRDALEQRAAAVAALENARAQFFRGATLLTAAVFAEAPTPLVDSYHQAQVTGDEGLDQARAELIAMGERDDLAALDRFSEDIHQLRQEVDEVLTFALTADRDTRVEVGQQHYPQMWPRLETMIADLDELAIGQQSKLTIERAAADRTADTTLALLLGFSAFAFLGGGATLILLVLSVVRPLAALQASARAVASGDLETRAKVSGPQEVVSLARDFNEMVVRRQRTEHEMRIKDSAIASSINAIAIADLEGNLTYINKSFLRLWGYDDDKEVLGKPAVEFWQMEEMASEVVGALRGEGSWVGELVARRKDGSLFDAQLSTSLVTDEANKPMCMMASFVDITERKRAEGELREQARRDPLTGVLNHGAIVDELRSLVSSDGDGAPCAVAMIDVDDLKTTNDMYGHQVGDNILVAVAGVLSRDGALVGRYGGDEFVAILPGADREAAERYCKEVLNALAGTDLTDPETRSSVPTVVSIGLAIYPEDAHTVADLIRLSDSAMYTAKRQRPVRPVSPHRRPPDKEAA